MYQLAEAILGRTKGHWVDPDRCGASVPENLVTELLDLKIPMQAIFDNPEKKPLLTQIEMPSTGWFSGYTRYIEAQPDQGEKLITARLGKGIWEHYHLVFDTFVHLAQFPLQYVFADHWLLDAWIVDEETRQKTSRLWLTLLIDAYSRSILGMALLYEDPWHSRPASRPSSMPSGKKRHIWTSGSSRNGHATASHCNCSWTMPGHTILTVWRIWHGCSRATGPTTPSISCFAHHTRVAMVPSLSGSSGTSW